MVYQLRPAAPRQPGLIDEALGGFQSGMGIANALQKMKLQKQLAQRQALMDPLKQQQLQAQIGGTQATTKATEARQRLLEAQRQALLGKAAGGGGYVIGPQGFPVPVGPQAGAAGAPVAGVQAGGQAPPQQGPSVGGAFVGSPIGATSKTVGTYYNPHTGESISALSPTGRTKLQSQKRFYAQLLDSYDNLKKTAKAGYGGPPILPGSSKAAYQQSLSQAQERLVNARNYPRTKEGFANAEKILGRYHGETDDAYSARIDGQKKEALEQIKRVDDALRVGGQRVGGEVHIQLPDGRTGTIPGNKLEEAIKMGAKKVS